MLSKLICAFSSFLLMPLMGGSIEGRVTNRTTGAGIEGVRLTAWIQNGPAPPSAIHEVVTGETGEFNIDDVPDGEYLILPAKSGFISKDAAQPASLRVSGKTRVDFQMSPYPSLRGRVLDPDGKPVEGITVKVTGAPDTITDKDGLFIFEVVRPGSQQLWATPEPQAEAKNEERVVTTYYPSVVEKDQAQAIKVEDVDLFGYDIRLRTARARRIRGVVIGPDGSPEENSTVVISKRATQAPIIMLQGALFPPQDPSQAEHLVANDDGSFEFPEVAEGDWLLRGIVAGHDPESNREFYRNGSVELKVGRRDIEDVEIRTNRSFPIDVSADWGDSPPAKAPEMLVNLVPLDGQFPSSPREGFAGRYLVGPVQAAPGFFAAAALLDNRDVLGQVVELSGPMSLKMIFKTGGGTVRGTVEKGANAFVLLMADATPAARIGFRARCDADGEFIFRDVPPGQYTVVALQRVGNLGTPEKILSVLEASGKRVKMDAGETAQVDLRLAQP